MAEVYQSSPLDDREPALLTELFAPGPLCNMKLQAFFNNPKTPSKPFKPLE